MSQILIKTVRRPMTGFGTKETWATEGYRRVAAPQAGHDFDSMSFPDQHIEYATADVGSDSQILGCGGFLH